MACNCCARVQTNKVMNAPSKMLPRAECRPLSTTNYVSLQREQKNRNNSEISKPPTDNIVIYVDSIVDIDVDCTR